MAKLASISDFEGSEDAENGGIRQEPELPVHEDIAPDGATPSEFSFDEDVQDSDAGAARKASDRSMAGNARTAALDPDDGIDL